MPQTESQAQDSPKRVEAEFLVGCSSLLDRRMRKLPITRQQIALLGDNWPHRKPLLVCRRIALAVGPLWRQDWGPFQIFTRLLGLFAIEGICQPIDQVERGEAS